MKIFFDSLFAFMVKSEDEDVDEEVTFLDFKHHLNVYSFKKMRGLAVVLIDSISESTTEKDFFD